MFYRSTKPGQGKGRLVPGKVERVRSISEDIALGSTKHLESQLYLGTEMVKWDPSLYENLRSQLHNYPDHISYDKDKVLERSVNRLIDACALYDRLGGDGRTVVQRCILEGPSFAEEKKKELANAFFNRYNISELDANRRRDEFDYNRHFPVRHLINWETPDPLDIKWSFEPVEYDTDEIELFRSELRRLLTEVVTTDEELIRFADDNMGDPLTSSSCLSESKIVGYEVLNNKEVEFESALIGQRCVIPIYPTNTRDAIKLKVGSLKSLLQVSKRLRVLLDEFSESSMTLHIEKAFNREFKLRKHGFKDGHAFYLRDLTKEGLTKPKILINIMVDELKKKFPRSFCRADIYNSIHITSNVDIPELDIKKGQPFMTERGHGLGMGNELTTLMQIVIWRMIETKLSPDFEKFECKATFYNDDMQSAGPLDQLYKLILTDQEIGRNLGLLYKEEKTMILKGATVYLEEYYTEPYNSLEKRILTLMTLNNAKYAYNITHAKSIIRSLGSELTDSEDELIINVLNELKSFWGYEFHRCELEMSSSFGGWHDFTYMYHDTSLERIEYRENLDYRVLQKILDAEMSNISFRIKTKRNKQSPKNRRKQVFYETEFQKPLVNTDGFDLELLSWNADALNERVHSGYSVHCFPATYWRILHLHRKNTYRRSVNTCFSLKDLVNYYFKRKPNKFIAIPEPFIEEWGSEDLMQISTTQLKSPGYTFPDTLLGRYFLGAYLAKTYEGVASAWTHLYDESLKGYTRPDFENIQIRSSHKTTYYKTSRLAPELSDHSPYPDVTTSFYVDAWGRYPTKVCDGIILPKSQYHPVYHEKVEHWITHFKRAQTVDLDPIGLYLLNTTVNELDSDNLDDEIIDLFYRNIIHLANERLCPPAEEEDENILESGEVDGVTINLDILSEKPIDVGSLPTLTEFNDDNEVFSKENLMKSLFIPDEEDETSSEEDDEDSDDDSRWESVSEDELCGAEEVFGFTDLDNPP